VDRNILGLPPQWDTVSSWLSHDRSIHCEEPSVPILLDPVSNLPKLDSYKGSFPAKFWANFPSSPLPARPSSKINCDALSHLIKSRSSLLRSAEVSRAARALDFLRNGAPSYLKHSLPTVVCKNNEQVYEHGHHLSATLASWVEKGFLAGPFTSPPLKGFRVNPLKVIEIGAQTVR